MRTLTIATLLIGGCASGPDQQLVYSAANYRQFGMVDGADRYAFPLCRPPVSEPRPSRSNDEGTHGKKLFYLYAKNRESYLHARDRDQPDGQVLVKESWYLPGAVEGGTRDWRTPGPLFLMMKQDGDWTYATATADGKTITAQGKLASCTGCHESERTRDRMFGLQSHAAAK